MTNAPTKIYSGEKPPSVSIDWEEYGHHLENSDLSDAQKRDFIETLWGIMLSFVDLGFGLHPVQQACEQNGIPTLKLPDDLLFSKGNNHDNQTTDTATDAFRQSADKEES